MRRWSNVLQMWQLKNRRKERNSVSEPPPHDFDIAPMSTAAQQVETPAPAPTSTPIPTPTVMEIPGRQRALLLHGTKQPYESTEDYAIPELRGEREILVKTHVIGLNPIDWKSPDYGFGIPELPFISGRESAGTVVKVHEGQSRFKLGDKVLVISTDYRDLRKATYQEYVIAADFNLARIPPQLSFEQGATLGVAFAAAVLALGICMGVDFSRTLDGPDLLSLVRDVPANALPEDIRNECLHGISAGERPVPGDWVVVWGASSTSAMLAVQLARIAGLRVVSVVDKARHGLRLSEDPNLRPDMLIDSHDPARAVEIIRGNLPDGQLRFGLDTRGRESADALLQALRPDDGSKASKAPPPGTPPSTPPAEKAISAHLVGLTGLPKVARPDGVVYHNVPIKLFHEVPAVGEALVVWLERLLAEGVLVPPRIVDVQDGLHTVNDGLDRMRNGEIRGGKLVVKVL